MNRRAVALPLLGILLGCASFRELPAWEKPPPPARDAPVVDAARLHRAELPNGMRVLVLEDPRAGEMAVGDVLIGYPTHICPTVALHARAAVVHGGAATGETWAVSARDR